MPIRHSRLPARRVDHRRPTAGVVVVPRSVTADFGQFSPMRAGTARQRGRKHAPAVPQRSAYGVRARFLRVC